MVKCRVHRVISQVGADIGKVSLSLIREQTALERAKREQRQGSGLDGDGRWDETHFHF